MNWFQRHLNWSLFLGTIFLPFVVGLIFFAIFFAVFASGFSSMAAAGVEDPEIIMGNMLNAALPFYIIYLFVGLALTVFAFVVTWWYLGQKARSKWFMLLLFAPLGFVFLLLLENQAIGYGGDFGDELVADRWPETGQVDMPDDWRPKELDYSPAKNVEDIAYGGAVKDVRDVGAPSEEVPAAFPPAFPPKAPEETPAEVSAEIPPEVPVEAAAETREEVPPEVHPETPAEFSVEAVDEVPAVPAEAKVAEEAVRHEALKMPILLDDAGAVIRCFYHPDVDAVNRCSRCGQYVCSQCNYVTGTHPICRNCWDRRGEVPLAGVGTGVGESARLSKSEGLKAEEDERLGEFMQMYEQAVPIISAVIKRGADGSISPPLDLMEGLKLRPMLEHAQKLPKPNGKELQEASKDFEQLLLSCIKIAEAAAEFVGSGEQAVLGEADLARLSAEIETANGFMEWLSQRVASLSQPQE
ncbi:hypothetical protein ACFLTN_07250 [Chloroflexota bacterium]